MFLFQHAFLKLVKYLFGINLIFIFALNKSQNSRGVGLCESFIKIAMAILRKLMIKILEIHIESWKNDHNLIPISKNNVLKDFFLKIYYLMYMLSTKTYIKPLSN